MDMKDIILFIVQLSLAVELVLVAYGFRSHMAFVGHDIGRFDDSKDIDKDLDKNDSFEEMDGNFAHLFFFVRLFAT